MHIAQNGRTALMAAANCGAMDADRQFHSQCIENAPTIATLLIRHAANRAEERTIDMTNKQGQTALMLAASRGHQKLVELLLEKGAQSNLANPFGMTALHMACKQRHVEVVDLLVNKHRSEGGADPDLKESRKGYTPLMVAAMMGHTDIVRALLERVHGTSLNLQVRCLWTVVVFM